MLRPQACRWFELVTTREAVARVLAALAHRGAVELQARTPSAAPLRLEGVEHALARYRDLARAYRAHWPAPAALAATMPGDAADTLEAVLARIDDWRAQADPLLAERERALAQRRDLDDVARLLDAGGVTRDVGLLATPATARVGAQVHVLPAREVANVDLPAELLSTTLVAGDEVFVVLVGGRDALQRAAERLVAAKARRVAWPQDLGGSPAQARREVQARRQSVAAALGAIEAALAELAVRHALPEALADGELIAWLVGHGGELEAGAHLVHVTGWTPVSGMQDLAVTLAAEALPAVLRFAAPPAGLEPPSLLRNPRWARPFEAFARMLGQPGPTEADPSVLLAFVAPLLFGMMFGDVGQGAVLMLAGWLLRRRLPVLALLVPGGAMAIVFGVLYGSVFAREDLIPALWLHPLHEPVPLLASAIGLGAAILLGGLALNALQAAWRGELDAWWRHEAALVVAYLSLGLALWHPPLAWLAPAALAWVVVAPALATRGGAASRLAAGAQALARFVEHGLQLLVNTVSFARVGAFALAHAGLSVAVIGVADASGPWGQWPVLVLGNVLILVLEGLVVSIQTTRLLLFEFFIRFLEGRGRVFRPLPPPFATIRPLLATPPGTDA